MSSKTKTTATKNEATPALVPKLRFPDFRGKEPWEPTTLNAIADPVTDRAVQDDEDNVLSLSAEHGIVLQSEFFGKKVAGDNSERYLKIARNDFVYNDRTTKASTFGTIKRLSKHAGGIVSPIYKCFRFDDDENPVFWAWYFESGTHNPALGGLVNEGARAGRFNISITQFLSTSAWRPTTAEQQKIAEFLSSVDELMAAQARKVDALKTHKKGLMRQLFPREGETQPRLRFPEFQNTGEWEPKSFGALGLDVSDGNYSSKYPSQSDFVATGVPFLRANNLKFGTVVDADMRFISEEQHSQITKGHLKQGDILITTRGELGTVALVPDRHIGSNINAQIVRINSGNKLVNTFLFQLLDYSREIGLFDTLSTGTALKQLPIGKLNQLALRIPRLRAEQQRIAECLSSLDALITAETQKHEALKTHKKGLMQQLFPSPEEVAA